MIFQKKISNVQGLKLTKKNPNVNSDFIRVAMIAMINAMINNQINNLPQLKKVIDHSNQTNLIQEVLL